MCLGIPMQIQSVDGFVARCTAKGAEREVNLFMLQDETIGVGDYVVVHLGNAISRMSEEEAAAAWEIYDAMLAAQDGGRLEV
ncbi:HypC/HybG/HupF family hydrogenase formation chaperone [Thiocapsa marina]|uniref:Hydrogenase assembly chaperone hypC/hupF n=1 Tax=Thiocapsa marina 5811 TaxID=768671 RepID=F9UGL3_9GAMM|nr:HypC/HybG/HupF family hydrogenase formation chaperone [Thiocapsa marina]EGV16696.1 hydrogenase assembly chaperone hypC/hupF [Thiocapsa marina 5811]